MLRKVQKWVIPLVLSGILLTGCASEAPEEKAAVPDRSVIDAAITPLSGADPDLSDAQFAEFRDALSSYESFHVSGVIDTGSSRQTMELDADQPRREFVGTLGLEIGGEPLEVEIVRASKLTWLRSTDVYWAAQGFDSGTIERARGKFVVFEPGVGEQIASTYDIAPLLRRLSAVDDAAVSTIGSVEMPDTLAFRYAVTTGDARLIVDVPQEDVRSFRLISEEGGASSVFTFDRLNEVVEVAVPAPDTVMQPEK